MESTSGSNSSNDGAPLLNNDDDATTNTTMPLRALVYTPAGSNGSSRCATLSVLDQLLLPHTVTFLPIDNVQAAWTVIRTMQVRGAPLIALTAVLGLAVHLQRHGATECTDGDVGGDETHSSSSRNIIQSYLHSKLDYLATSRPTAVNLFHALSEIRTTVQATLDIAASAASSSCLSLEAMRDSVVQAVVLRAQAMLAQDVADCQALAECGAQELLDRATAATTNNQKKNLTLMTICNTGSLATAGCGTALGVIRTLHERHARLHRVITLETRPYNQGSRLTALECQMHALPNPLLICDSMAAAYMNTNTNNSNMNENAVFACVVGADRVAANGDTANKIGTYQLAVGAAAHGVPFYVAAPTTTLDGATASGSDILIEERPPAELRESSQAPDTMPVWNPAFDVTPAKYIAGIITEKGMIKPNEHGIFDIKGFLAKHAAGSGTSETREKTNVETNVEPKVMSEYTEQTISSLPIFVAKHVPKAMEAMRAESSDDLECIEMGDGNLNLVFILSNKNSTPSSVKLIVKQALPYVRCVGESWPLTLERAFFEYSALTKQKAACPEFVPELYYFSKEHALMVMQYLAPPIQILRKGLIQGVQYPTMAQDLGDFCARTLFRSSGFCLSGSELRKNVEFWSRNIEMCALTEQVVFTEPYVTAENNRWTSPQLDDEKIAIENDLELKVAAASYKVKFVTQTETLIHADLHTGSVMCAPDPPNQTFVIDPEFAFYGPAAFDTGACVANLFLAYVSQQGHRPGDKYDEWILEQIGTFWQHFVTQFLLLWNDPVEHSGFVFCNVVFGSDADAVRACQDKYIQTLLADTLGFAGMKMLRRIVGIAHVEDLESIEDVNVRAQSEKRGLGIAKAFIKSSASFATMDDAIQFARSFST